MSAMARTIAAAVVADLNAATLSQSVTFAREYVVREDLESTSGIAGGVVAAAERARPDNRSGWVHEYDIDIGVQKKFGSDANAESDALADFIEEIADYFKTRKPSGTSARLTAIDLLWPNGVPEHMTTLKQFTGVVRLTFRLVRTNS